MSYTAINNLRRYFSGLKGLQRALFPKALADKLRDPNCPGLTIFKLSLRYSSLHSPGLYQFYSSPEYKIWQILEDNNLFVYQ